MTKRRLRQSLFPGCAPYLNFLRPGEEYEDGEEPGEDMRLGFTVARGTGQVIVDCLNKFGFKINKWNMRNLTGVKGPVWDRLFFASKEIQMQIDYQKADPGVKISSFPGTSSICRKDFLCRNYRSSQERFGENCFDFLPETVNIPEDWDLLKEKMSRSKTMWIVKPPTGFAGKGIRLVSKPEQIGNIKSTLTVQKYVMNPFLIKGLKFDIRLYVLLTSIDPVKLYLYNDGLVRFATEPFSTREEDLGNKFIHITNSVVNKDNTVFNYGEGSNEFEGYKWSLNTLFKFLKLKGLDCSIIWTKIEQLVLKTVLCGRKEIEAAFNNVQSDYNCFKLLGFDILLDETLKPWLLEVNNFPSFEPEGLDRMVNEPMISEMFNIVGFHITEPLDSQRKKIIMKSQRLNSLVEFNPHMYNRLDDKESNESFEGYKTEESNIVKQENLTARNVRTLIQSEEELSQTENFSRLLPYQILEKADLECLSDWTTNDRLVEVWDNLYRHNTEEGRTFLSKLCEKGLHLED